MNVGDVDTLIGLRVLTCKNIAVNLAESLRGTSRFQLRFLKEIIEELLKLPSEKRRTIAALHTNPGGRCVELEFRRLPSADCVKRRTSRV